jgi:hypothetical protein
MDISKYASDSSAAEKGLPTSASPPLEEKPPDTVDNPGLLNEKSKIQENIDTSITPDVEGPKSAQDVISPFAQYIAPEAPIWARYLDEAEVEDKELIDPWNGSLDSLLIFVSGPSQHTQP